MHPRRTCPACARRYAGLVAPDCPICQGLGVLSLGAAATATHTPAAVSRAIELYLETHAARQRNELPLGLHRDALADAVDELRLAGVLSSPHDPADTNTHPTAPTSPDAIRPIELDAYRYARTTLNTTITTTAIHALAAPPTTDLTTVRPRNGPPTGSANGHTSALATTADPIDPLSVDTAVITADRYADHYRARVIAEAIPHTLTARRKATP